MGFLTGVIDAYRIGRMNLRNVEKYYPDLRHDSFDTTRYSKCFDGLDYNDDFKAVVRHVESMMDTKDNYSVKIITDNWGENKITMLAAIFQEAGYRVRLSVPMYSFLEYLTVYHKASLVQSSVR